ncbi:ubiquitin carboxyl-terminal hydrolase [Aspergillus luchuensis]|uniref:Ubiquitin carboxyl-terminal hydrolase n=1 Tax=Aspergillus kawachii TaxID=1069201 RepID=A0A146FBZ8_ASPKA|nr:ubiquitin carboxyl-terminal hydrolase [Aspergillus luchuensis]
MSMTEKPEEAAFSLKLVDEEELPNLDDDTVRVMWET